MHNGPAVLLAACLPGGLGRPDPAGLVGVSARLTRPCPGETGLTGDGRRCPLPDAIRQARPAGGSARSAWRQPIWTTCAHQRSPGRWHRSAAPSPGRSGSGHDGGWPAAHARHHAPLARRAGSSRVRLVMRVLSCVVIVSAAITVWTRAALVFVLGPQLTSACLWIAAGGSLCAV